MRLAIIRNQIALTGMALFNTLYNLCPFFCIRNACLRLLGNKIGKQTFIHRNMKLTHANRLSIGDNCTVNYSCLLDTRYGISIGNNVMIGHNCRIYTLGHDIDDPMFKAKGGPVNIEDNAVLFTNILVMPNIIIHEGAIVFPGSVVTKDVGAFDIVGGNPAKFIRKRINNIDYKLVYGYWFGN